MQVVSVKAAGSVESVCHQVNDSCYLSPRCTEMLFVPVGCRNELDELCASGGQDCVRVAVCTCNDTASVGLLPPFVCPGRIFQLFTQRWLTVDQYVLIFNPHLHLSHFSFDVARSLCASLLHNLIFSCGLPPSHRPLSPCSDLFFISSYCHFFLTPIVFLILIKFCWHDRYETCVATATLCITIISRAALGEKKSCNSLMDD